MGEVVSHDVPVSELRILGCGVTFLHSHSCVGLIFSQLPVLRMLLHAHPCCRLSSDAVVGRLDKGRSV